MLKVRSLYIHSSVAMPESFSQSAILTRSSKRTQWLQIPSRLRQHLFPRWLFAYLCFVLAIREMCRAQWWWACKIARCNQLKMEYSLQLLLQIPPKNMMYTLPFRSSSNTLSSFLSKEPPRLFTTCQNRKHHTKIILSQRFRSVLLIPLSLASHEISLSRPKVKNLRSSPLHLLKTFRF